MDLSGFTDVIELVKTPLSYLVLVTLLAASLCYYFFKNSKPLIKLVVFLFIISGFSAGAFFLLSGDFDGRMTKIVFMDSIVKINIYDEENREKGIINSHRIRDIVNDIEGLNAELVIEPTNYEWKYEDNVLKMNPDLIIIHYSAFELETVGYNDERAKSKFRSFLKYMEPTKSKFIIYTRGKHFEKGDEKQKTIEETGLEENRLFFFRVKSPHTFKDPTIEREFKTLMREIIGLEVKST